MPQQTCPAMQSASALQNLSAACAGSQIVAVDASDGRTHAWPCAVSHFVSSVHGRGHAFELMHALVPFPKSQQSSPVFVSQS